MLKRIGLAIFSVTVVFLVLAAAKSELVNIIEEDGRPLPFQKNSLRLKVGHHSIETLNLWPQKAEED